MSKDIYQTIGYYDREDYFLHLAEDYEVDPDIVMNLADLLGPNEDFDGLVTALEDMVYDSETYP